MCNGGSDEGIFDSVGFGYGKSESRVGAQVFCMLCCHQLDRLCTAHFCFALAFAFIFQDNSALKITHLMFSAWSCLVNYCTILSFVSLTRVGQSDKVHLLEYCT